MNIFPDTYPTEYIDGKVNFFGRDFVVTPDVLIPRLETEVLVKRARQLLGQSTKNQKSKTIIDIGCGSGIIGTSVADLADEIIFLDISPEALIVTEANFRSHFPDKKAQFIVSDLLDKLPLQREYREEGRDLVSKKKSPLPLLRHNSSPKSGELETFTKGVTTLFLTNLPYIRSEDWIHMSADTVHEPRLALFGGDLTGFEMYERLFVQITELDLAHFQLLCEFGFDQREVAESVLAKYPQWQSSFFADYAGIERFAEVSL